MRTRLRVGCFLLFVLLILLPGVLVAGEGRGEVSRRVLGLYNGKTTEYGEPSFSDIQDFLEMPLNHLGFTVEYADVNKPLPDFRPYRGIVVWLSSNEMDGAERFLPWLLEAARAGVKLIFPSGIAAPNSPGGPPVGQEEERELYRLFGLEATPYDMNGVLADYRVDVLRPERFSFETDLFPGDAPVPSVRAVDASTDVWLKVIRRDDPEREGAAIVAGPAGFWAVDDNILFFSVFPDKQEYRAAWNIDPFAMLEVGLNCAGLPRPDATTYWGTRGAYIHVDTDGAYNMSQPDVPGPSRFAMRVVLDEIWRKYPYPTTVGLITAEYRPDIDLRFIQQGETLEQTLNRKFQAWERPHAETAAKLRELAKEVFALPNTQVGCHGYSHPLFWRKLIPGYAIRGYTPTYEDEVRGAVEYLDREVLPPGKTVELFQWPGDCDPPEEALAILDAMGLANINGGDPLYDSRYDSVYFVCGLSRLKGKYRQIHTSGSNDNIYTKGWTAEYLGAFANVIETFERSDSPRRLLPVNIYYHLFPAERLSGLLAIKRTYDWAAARDLCWMTAREYVRAVESFFPVRLGETEDGGWWAEEYGSCPTLRFDGEKRRVDMRRSVNVAGYSFHNGSLYVSLIPGKRAEIRLADGAVGAPCLAGASGLLKDIAREQTKWRGLIRAWGPGFIELWAPMGTWRAVATGPDGVKSEGEAKRLPDGRLRFEFPGASGQWMEVRFEQ